MKESSKKKALFLILAGGRGERLRPLTDLRPKPLVRFGSRGAIIDFTLYNCLSYPEGDVYVLTQYLSEMVDVYLRMYWAKAFTSRGRRLLALPGKKSIKGKYLGTADAVYQTLVHLPDCPELVVVLASDHIYRMDYEPMLDFHLSHHNCATVGAVTAAKESMSRFGIMAAKPNGRIQAFHEKPANPDELEIGADGLASMGIYIFNRDELMKYLVANQRAGSHDFGRDIIPKIVGDNQAFAFPFTGPDGHSAYWQDVGDLEAYWQAQMNLLSRENRPIFEPLPGIERMSCYQSDLIGDYEQGNRRIRQSLIANTAQVGDARIEQSVIGPGAVVEDGAFIRQSILLDGAAVRKDAELLARVLEPYAEVRHGSVGSLNPQRTRESWLSLAGPLAAAGAYSSSLRLSSSPK